MAIKFCRFWAGGNVEPKKELLSVLLKERIYDVLFLLHAFFAFLEAVALALDVDDGAVMEYPVKDSRGDGDIGKSLIPLREGLV